MTQKTAKKFTRTFNEYADETAMMDAVYAKPRRGRPVKGQQTGRSYSISWGDLRRIWFGLKAAGRCPVDERAHDAIKDALLTLHRRTAGRLELAEDAQEPRDGRPAKLFRVTWPGGEIEEVAGLALVAEKLGTTPNALGALLSRGSGIYTKTLKVWDAATRSPAEVRVTVARLD